MYIHNIIHTLHEVELCRDTINHYTRNVLLHDRPYVEKTHTPCIHIYIIGSYAR